MDPHPDKSQLFKAITEMVLRLSQYTQIDLVEKLEALDVAISPAAFSNMLKKHKAGMKMLTNTFAGLQKILITEKGEAYDIETGQFISTKKEQWHPEVIQPKSSLKGFRFYPNGRITVEEKVKFIEHAQEEVIEVGIRLNTFSQNLTSQNSSIFKRPLINLMERGVSIRNYMIDPNSQEAMQYFEDRGRTMESERRAIDEIRRVIERLSDVTTEFNHLNLPGKFEVYKYRHFPSAFFYAVDAHLPSGKMIVAAYLYGVKRADCPVIEIHRSEQPALFMTYLKSMELFIRNAVKIELNPKNN
jgi:hypothetical protein